MLKIVYPIDFSEHSQSGLEYAMKLSQKLGAQMHIVSISKKNIPDLENKMEMLLTGANYINGTDILISAKVIEGEFVASMESYISENDIDMILMTTLGNQDLENIVFGSATSKLAKKINIPLLAIPEHAKAFAGDEKMVLALDNKILERESTFQIANHLASVVGLKIDVVHFESGDEYDLPVDPYIAEYLGDNLGEIIVEKYDSFLTGINKYCDNNKVGLVMMVKRPSGYLKNLLCFGNTTQELANSKLPLLILPDLQS